VFGLGSGRVVNEVVEPALRLVALHTVTRAHTYVNVHTHKHAHRLSLARARAFSRSSPVPTPLSHSPSHTHTTYIPGSLLGQAHRASLNCDRVR